MAGINLATKYESKLNQAFAHGSYTDAWINKQYDFTGVKTIEVYTFISQALSNYDRTSTGDRFGGHNEAQDNCVAYTLANDKCFKIAIDEGNYTEQQFAKKAGEVLKIEMDEQYTPAVDKVRLTKAAIGAAAASQYYSPTANDAYGDVLKMSADLDEAKAPITGRVLFVTPLFYNNIKKQITTTVNASEYNGKLLGKGFVGELDGTAVVKVPSSYFPTNTSAIMLHRDALLGANKIKNVKILDDSELVDGKVIKGRFIFDAFVLDAKKKAVAAIGTGSLS